MLINKPSKVSPIEYLTVVAATVILIAVAIPAARKEVREQNTRANVAAALDLIAPLKKSILTARSAQELATHIDAFNALNIQSKNVHTVKISADGNALVTLKFSDVTGVPTQANVLTMQPFIRTADSALPLLSNIEKVKEIRIEWACAGQTNATATARGMGAIGRPEQGLYRQYAPPECS